MVNTILKIYPEEKLAELIKEIDEKVILLGGPEDKLKGDKIAKDFPDKVFNSCGKFSLNKSAGIVEKAKLVITNDTGLMHIAAAFKRKSYQYGEILFRNSVCIRICLEMKSNLI